MTPLEKLKALAAAKKAKEAASAGTPVETKEVAAVPAQVADATDATVQASTAETSSVAGTEQQAPAPAQAQEAPPVQHAAVVENSVPVATRADHPLVMELAELEQALKQQIPEFRTVLRDIHQKLRQDPELVTVMSDEEIGLIVSGLVLHTNTEIIAPKAAKAARAASKAKVTADDL